MRTFLGQILGLIVLLGLVGLVGCHQTQDAVPPPGSPNDFPAGAAVYTKSNHAYAGRVLNYEAQHTFPDGQSGAGVLMQSQDGQAGWYHADALRKTLTTR